MPGGAGGSRAKREAQHNESDHTHHKGEGVATRRNRVQSKKLDEIMGHINRGRGKR